MPKSKCNKAVTLSKAKKKGREHKEVIVNTIRETVEGYNSAYVFTFGNMRNFKFKEFGEQLKSNSRNYELFVCHVMDRAFKNEEPEKKLSPEQCQAIKAYMLHIYFSKTTGHGVKIDV